MGKQWPGGLRVQALLGFILLIGVTFGLLGLVTDRIVEARLRQAYIARIEAFAQVQHVGDLTALPPDIESVERIEKIEENDVSWKDGQLIVDVAGAPGTRVIAARTFDAELASTRRLIGTFLVMEALLLLTFVYALFTFLVVRPLRAIGVAADRASAGDLASSITLLPPNEFGRVGSSFNSMLHRLDEGRIELELRLTALEKANKQLAAAQASLIRSEKLASVGQLSAGIAHEIGNPLAAVSGFNELLLDGGLDPDQRRDLLERTQVQVQRIRAIIRKLLDFSRDDEAEIEATSIGKCVAEAMELVKAMPDARGVDFHVETTDSLVSSSHGELVQVIVNILMNAVDALADCDEPRISVLCVSSENTERLVISDNGHGIPTEIHEQIFEPFFTTKDPGEGTGLGLAISARILERFGAQISVEATDEGTTFALTFRRWEQA